MFLIWMFSITRLNFSSHILTALQTMQSLGPKNPMRFAFGKTMSPSGGGFWYYSWGALNIFPSCKTVTEQFNIEAGSY